MARAILVDCIDHSTIHPAPPEKEIKKEMIRRREGEGEGGGGGNQRIAGIMTILLINSIIREIVMFAGRFGVPRALYAAPRARSVKKVDGLCRRELREFVFGEEERKERQSFT